MAKTLDDLALAGQIDLATSFTGKKRIRKSFGRIPEAVRMPNLIEVQRASYEQFLQREGRPGQRTDEGIEAVFKSVFPIRDFNERAVLEYVSYEFEEPKYDVDECIQRDMTYAAPLKVKLRLIVFEADEETGARSVKDIKEQDVYMGDIPLMTDKGTFIVNGTERVIVSQMHRSPGVFFDHDKGKTHASGKLLFAARVIPYRGSWLDFEFDAKDIVYVRIDRRRKLPATTFLYALGMDGEEILRTFYETVPYEKRRDTWVTPYKAERWRGVKPEFDLVDADTGEVIAPAGQKISARAAKKLGETVKSLSLAADALLGKYLAADAVNVQTGEIYAEAGDELDQATINVLEENGFSTIDVLDIDHVTVGAYMRNTLRVDKNAGREDALFDVYRVMRPGEPPTPEAADSMFKSLFFDAERYDLSAVGRVKMNMRLETPEVGDEVRVLRKDDVLKVLQILVGLKDGRGEIDDIDNLGNRRVRSVGELLENQYRVGLLRMERAIKERMSSVDIDTVMPHDLINAKPAAAAVREFFGSSQLSQFMDQTNPLSEITHKRRLSALGPGGLTRERAGFEVRDVHPTHYGRICPIETPEGPNIGLINSLATHAVVNKYGFIESPYRRIKDGRTTDEVVYMSAMEEAKHVIAQANIRVENGEIVEDLVPGRINGEPSLLPRADVDLMDVSPKQGVSVAASLIPFLENDDANRALMGSNMQKQAVPLIQSDAPLVGTGMESSVAVDSGAVVVARRTGVVEQIDGTRI
ncbi:DNA-directed RNA polymerase subunit beta, partial [Brevundimonas sp.]|uniref:DNA-directed RNA polymerase subunit beta n=1 Tax=Brevundimonas sp. TaxID=1871086 RepID=UPI00391CC04E